MPGKMGTVLAVMMPLGTPDEGEAGKEIGTHSAGEQEREGIPAERFIIRFATTTATENEINTMEDGVPATRFIIRTTAADAVGRNSDEGQDNRSYAKVSPTKSRSPAGRLTIKTTASALGSSIEGTENGKKPNGRRSSSQTVHHKNLSSYECRQ
jgi:hypothetical protein